MTPVMKVKAVDEAEKRLIRAWNALNAMLNHAQRLDFVATETSWTELLLHSNAVYTKLEQGAKDDPKSRQWFGGKKRERRDDPLLQYLHQARNSDEHTLEAVIETSNSITAESAHPSVIFQDGTLHIPHDFRGAVLNLTPPHFRLLDVVDHRWGAPKRYSVPTSHLGTQLPTSTPIAVAIAALSYQQRLVAEARELVR